MDNNDVVKDSFNCILLPRSNLESHELSNCEGACACLYHGPFLATVFLSIQRQLASRHFSINSWPGRNLQKCRKIHDEN